VRTGSLYATARSTATPPTPLPPPSAPDSCRSWATEGGVWSFVHLEDAAAATVLALEHDGPGIYNIVDDEPATTAVWLTELAKILGAAPPQHAPVEQARAYAGEAMVVMFTEARGASNAKAKRELGWTLRYPSWRQGFAAAYAEPEPFRRTA
jgi:nucleoside-diphosphate-sugar epimerase